MSTLRTRLSPRAAARILDQKEAADDAVSRLVNAASAPVSADRRGEELAVAQFRAVAHLGPVPTPEGETFMLRTARKLLAAPVAALGAAALLLAGGGIALAASQGALNVPFTGHDHRSDKAPAAPATTNPGLSRATTTAGARPTASPTPSASPSPSLAGLCQAFQAGAAEVNHSNPAFAALVTAAGGDANIATYCVGLIGPATGPTHPAMPTQAATPTHPAAPTQAATPTRPDAATHAATPAQRSSHATH